MFVTAQAIQTRVGPTAPILAGPDVPTPTRAGACGTPYDTFTNKLLNKLAERVFILARGSRYSHHNYKDATHDHGPGSTAPDAAHRAPASSTAPPRCAAGS